MPDQISLFGSDDMPPANKAGAGMRQKAAAESHGKSTTGTGESEPLAARMRPRTLDEIVGQEQLLAPGRSIEADRIPSMILWGPPGSGKTTLAEVIARQTNLPLCLPHA